MCVQYWAFTLAKSQEILVQYLSYILDIYPL